jgi:hypothetical protein
VNTRFPGDVHDPLHRFPALPFGRTAADVLRVVRRRRAWGVDVTELSRPERFPDLTPELLRNRKRYDSDVLRWTAIEIPKPSYFRLHH